MKWFDKIFKRETTEQPMQVPLGWLPGMTRPYINEVADACTICGATSDRNMDGHALCQSHLGFALGARDSFIRDFYERKEAVPTDMIDRMLELMRSDYENGKIL